MKKPMRRIPAAAASMLALALSGACGGGGVGSASPDPGRSRELIREALDAWQGGDARGLARRDPPIRFVDPDLAGGSNLVGYTIAGEDEARPSGPVLDMPVTLRLKPRRGPEREVRAVYQVAIEPNLAVLRNDPD